MQTTLNKIKSHSPCEDGWKKLLNYLGKTEADDEPLELRTILESNGLDDTIWVFRALEGKDKEIRLFAADCAELVLPIYEKQYPDDNRPHKVIHAARDCANGIISEKELAAARAAACDAWDAAWAARASWDAWDAASAARDAARAAAWDAAWAAARDARAAEFAAERTAWDAAWAARAAARNEIKSLLLKYI